MRWTAKLVAVKDVDGRFYRHVKNLLTGYDVFWTMSDQGYNAAKIHLDYRDNLTDYEILLAKK